MMRIALLTTAMAAAACGYTNPGLPADAAPAPCPLGPLDMRVSTLAGCDDAGADDGARVLSRFANPVNVVVGPDGSVYVADFDSNRVRKVGRDGQTTTLVNKVGFQHPFGMVFGADGKLYVETDDNDKGAHNLNTGTIWRVDPELGITSVVIRDIGRPRGLALLPDGRIAMADHQHMVIEVLDPLTRAVTVIAGSKDLAGHVNATGGFARFAQPYDLVVLNGDLIVSEYDNHLLRRVTLSGVVTDFAGTGSAGHTNGALAAAAFGKPQGLAIDKAGTIYVTDVAYHDVRKIAGGQVSTLAGTGTAGYRDADDPMMAEFYGVEGLDVASDGKRIVVADGTIGTPVAFNHVRQITQP